MRGWDSPHALIVFKVVDVAHTELLPTIPSSGTEEKRRKKGTDVVQFLHNLDLSLDHLHRLRVRRKSLPPFPISRIAR